MTGLAFFEILVLLISGAGGAPRDLVSFLDAEDYLRARGVLIKADDIGGLVSKDPKDGKTQVSQLLAIRWLAEHPEETKKADGARAALEAVAQGKNAQDPRGFAKDYAQRALAKLDGKPLPASTGPPAGSVRDTLRWFPANVTLVMGVDLRGAGEAEPLAAHPLGGLLGEMLGPKDREEFYRFADAVGNFRIDRAAIALEIGPKGHEPERIYVHVTGVGNAKKLAEFMLPLVKGSAISGEKGPSGEPILILSGGQHPPAIAVIGDTDLVMAGYMKEEANHVELLRQILDVRAGKSTGVMTGPLKDLFQELPLRPAALIAGELNDELRKELTGGGSPFGAAPRRFVVDLGHEKGTAIHLRGAFANEAEAKAFVNSLDKLKKEGAEALKNPPAGVRIPADTAKVLTNTLNNFQLEAKGNAVIGTLAIPPETVKAFREIVEGLMKGKGGSPPAPEKP